MTKEPMTQGLIRRIRRIKRKYGIDDSQIKAKIAEHDQAEVKAQAAQIRNKERRIKTKEINRKYSENPRKVHREILKKNIEVKNPPKKEDLEQFWRPLFENAKQHQENEWIETVKLENEEKATMGKFNISNEHFENQIQGSRKL